MRFRDISISWKLTLLTVVTTLLSMVAVISAGSIIDRQLAQMSMIETYTTMGDVLGQELFYRRAGILRTSTEPLNR